MKLKSTILFTILFSSYTFAQDWFSAQKVTQHISILAADSLGGRATGSKFEEKAANYIIKQLKSNGIQPKGENGTWLQQFDFSAGLHGTGGRTGKANNVIGFLDNKAKYTIVIGAHYDHLGDGVDGHSLDGHPEGKIHNGADDNASGVAGVIELARYFSQNNEKEAFNFLFICFSGEELGLLGSVYFCEHPTIDISNINCMINMDMIGRLSKENASLAVSGTGTAAPFEKLVKSFENGALKITTDSAGVGPSDHTSFYNKGIPVLHFFSGTHADYHKPSDDIEKINAQGEEVILLIIAGLIEQLPKEEKLAFLNTRNPSMGTSAKFKVTLGIMPSYANTDNGLKVEAVLDGKAAMKAGMKDGDIITQIGDYPVKEIQTYMEALGKFNKGDKTKVKLIRDKAVMVLEVEF
jgi:hypothetical protein